MKLIISMINRLKTQHLDIENVLLAVRPERLLVVPAHGKWNIHDNIAHLARYQPVFINRIHQILHSELPSFGRYSAEEDPEFIHWRMEATDTLIRRIQDDRRVINDLIINLTGNRLLRYGIHQKFGSLTVIQWTEFFLLHEAHHIFTIFQLAYNTEL